MELLKYDAAWFLSKAGCNMFNSLESLEDRSVFMYSYLKQIANGEFEQDGILFKAAFFLADAVLGSSLSYSSYPDILDPAKNPFVTYLDCAERCPGAGAVYSIFLSILHGVADPAKHNEWIYDENMENVIDERPFRKSFASLIRSTFSSFDNLSKFFSKS